jgi:hypothetical protein
LRAESRDDAQAAEPTETLTLACEGNETGINFHGGPTDIEWSIQGRIDRVTGDLIAMDKLGDLTTFYSLKCKPTQRMF